MEKRKTVRKRNGAIGRSKVKTGCLTCRIRHKKCDEKRPSCSQCAETDRVCDFLKSSNEKGIFQKQNGTTSLELLDSTKYPNSISQPLSPRSSTPVADIERFRIMLRQHFSFHFQVELLERLVLQAAHTEPCIRHCIIAIANLRQEPRNNRGRSMHLSPLRQYNLAIQELNRSADGSFEGLALVVITSMLFVYIELLQGSTDHLIMHSVNAFSLMKSFLSLPPSSGRNAFGDSFQVDLQDLFIALSRINIRASARLGFSYNFAPSRITHLPQAFTTIETARNSLNTVKRRMNDILSYGAQQTLFPVQLETDLSTINSLLNLWHEKFTTFTYTCCPTDINQNAMLDILRIEFLVSQIEFSTAFLHQLAYDLETPRFRRIVDLAEQIVEADQADPHQSFAQGPCFVFDVGMAQLLSFVAQKCREPIIRRRAIQVLGKVRRERVPDVQVLVRACRWVVEKEEEGCGLDGMVVEERRFYDFEVDWNCAIEGKYKVRGRRLKIDGAWEDIFGIV